MKKLLIGILIILIAVSCKENKAKVATPMTPIISVYKTLNGLDATDAAKKIQNFQDFTSLDRKPSVRSFWISKEMLHDIVLLLTSEKQQQIAEGRADITDGIRIYVTSDGKATVSTHPINISIALVSTKDNGASSEEAQSCPTGRRHLDYYDHSVNALLYSLRSFEQNCLNEAGCAGATLYNCPSCPGLPGCTSTPHDIPLPMAIQMVSNFHDHPINTHGEWFDLGLFEILDKETRHNGIRIYFSTYPKISNKYLSERDAFIITTTEDPNNTGTNTDYYDCTTAAAYKKLYDSKKYAHSRTLPQDNGELCPNNCN